MNHRIPPPSWFSSQGSPLFSTRGRAQDEDFTWGYVTAMARDGDYWHEITPEQMKELLDPSETTFFAWQLDEAILGRGMGFHKFNEITLTLQDHHGAFSVGGLRWNRLAWDKACE